MRTIVGRRLTVALACAAWWAQAVAAMPGPVSPAGGVLLPAAGAPVALAARGRPERTGHSVARVWNEELLAAIRRDTPRPTVHARNLFHLSVAMYDAWAAYDPVALGVIHREKAVRAGAVEAARREAISHAAHHLLRHRFASSPGAVDSLASFDATLRDLGYTPVVTTVRGNAAAALGKRVAASVIAHGLADGAREDTNYSAAGDHLPVNPPLLVEASGVGALADIDRWQPLWVPGAVQPQRFLTPHWRQVAPFALARPGPGQLYADPEPPPRIGGPDTTRMRQDVLALVLDSGTLDPSDGVVVDASPAVVGNRSLGSDEDVGHALNPASGQPYPPNPMLRGDRGRALAEFWADGPLTSTPPGHWNEIANAVADHPAASRRLAGEGPALDRLEWDVKLYLALNGALHDAAIATWEVKAHYDSARPITLIRGMAELGQSSDPARESYHPAGLPLLDGAVEEITTASSAPGERHAHLAAHVGQIAIFAWQGHPADPASQHGGCGWILAADWWPYQQRGFVTPPFAGYTSGHSTFSRAAAEVLAAATGDAYFPGGLGEYAISADGEFRLGFEHGPELPVRLQWATYADAADEAGRSRRYGGIHPAFDDLPARAVGHRIGQDAFVRALEYFRGQAAD